MRSQAVLTQRLTLARLSRPVAVKLCSPEVIHSSHSFRSWVLNGRLQLKSSGCSCLVRPPGMTAGVVFSFPISSSTSGAMWAPMESITSRAFFVLKKPSGRLTKHLVNHVFISAQFIQPLGMTEMTTPRRRRRQGGRSPSGWSSV